jgi:hypothetical protein
VADAVSGPASPAGRGVPFRLVVEEGKVHEFARATKSASAEHLREQTPVSPLTFLASATLWMRPENSAWHGASRNFANILHGEQEFVFHEPPPPAGTELNAVQVIGNVFEKAGRRGGRMTFTEVVTTFWRDSPDRPTAVATALSIETHAADPPAAPSAAAVSAGVVEQSPRQQWMEPFVDEPLTVTDFVKYQGASGDFNPIHHDTEFAQAAGFPGPFAVGMLPAGIAAAQVTTRYGALAVQRFRVRWQNQAWPGDVLSYHGHLPPTPTSDFDLELAVTRPDGSPHLRAWVTLAPGYRA